MTINQTSTSWVAFACVIQSLVLDTRVKVNEIICQIVCLFHSTWQLDSVCHTLHLNYVNKALGYFSGFISGYPLLGSNTIWTALNSMLFPYTSS